MNSLATTTLADEVLAIPRAHEAELRAAGVNRLSLFGSGARGDHGPESAVDLAVEFDPDLFRLVGHERQIGELVGGEVDLLPEPIGKPRLRANIEPDRKLAF